MILVLFDELSIILADKSGDFFFVLFLSNTIFLPTAYSLALHFIKTNSCTCFKKHSFTFTLKTLKLVKKCSVKGVIIKPYMFRSLFHDHHQGSSFVLSAPTTYQPPASSFVYFGFVAVCPLFVCVSGVPVCVLSGREFFLTSF
jgi:hypothetical protein